MDLNIFITVLAGVLTYVLGQITVKLIIEPVQELKKSIGKVAHGMVMHASVISNPGVPTTEVMHETSKELRMLSSDLHTHLRLVPCYPKTALVFGLPSRKQILDASSCLIGLSNSVHRASENVYDANAARVEKIHDSLGIYLADGERHSKIGA
jgi:hypothetical protein